jgi:hypothetical protein
MITHFASLSFFYIVNPACTEVLSGIYMNTDKKG